MKFIQVSKGWYDLEDNFEFETQELLLTRTIDHVYQMANNRQRICIEYFDRNGEKREVIEDCGTSSMADKRIEEINKILNKEEI